MSTSNADMLLYANKHRKQKENSSIFFSKMDGRELRGTTTTVIIIIKREPLSTRSCFSTYFESVSSLSLFIFPFLFSRIFQGRMQVYIVV